ncbi:glycoside hydrolase family 27 protein [Aurantiacibacter xanthus]|uniref:Alpha-galactosidase n=1 Tax=Aurantiacibacter xanthus TaxID=1784712 RepID=A0A3A1P619_9SPHN|nr:glycoside hydrolase family 27 protein [Aurantiacibacter xanthus]RIV82319.1 glycoside hydrolase family 27 protein [Aurantiacibacter xanthus]
MTLSRRGLLGAGLTTALVPTLASAASVPGARASASAQLAPTPPMGWNSWNSFATTITEEQTLEQAAIMQRDLLPAGYDILTVDIQWYEPAASSYQYNTEPEPVLDGFGRLLPAPNRFPSSEGGHGFAPLAARVHALGLRFGVHLMRGIPRLAVKRDLPVLGTEVTAAQIADTTSLCSWNPDMYGVDMSKPGAQAYYDSVFALFAAWGVDFVKVDDLSRPYDAHAPEIEAIHRAIVNSGRPMILSMSPGETPVIRGDHARAFAQMWRISDDFWDEWPMLEAQFTRLENWNPFMGEGSWPDADMLPLGRLALGERDTKFTPDEQQTVMTLWSIARSPLIMGGDLRHLDAATKALLTNPEVIAVNQASFGNRPHFVEDRTRIWSARAPNGDHYLALFNTGNDPREVGIDLDMLGINRAVSVRNLWTGQNEEDASGRLSRAVRPHGSVLLRLS